MISADFDMLISEKQMVYIFANKITLIILIIDKDLASVFISLGSLLRYMHVEYLQFPFFKKILCV